MRCAVQRTLWCTCTPYAQADRLFEAAQQQARDVVGGGIDRQGPPVDRLKDVTDAQPGGGGRRALDHADDLNRARAVPHHVAHGHADAAVVCRPFVLGEQRSIRARREVARVPVAELGQHRAHSTARLCHRNVVRVRVTVRVRVRVGRACAIEVYLRLR